MPRYEWVCRDCHYLVDFRSPRFYKASEENPPICPTCDKPMIFSWGAPGIQYRGDGFFTTDSKKKQNE